MATLMSLLAVVVWVANIVLFIMVLIKLFKKEGVLLGILGLICGIYTFIWGWMNSGLVGKNIMIAWTVCIVLSIILNGAVAGMGGF